MPDFSMWGPAESGTRLYQQDLINNALRGAQTQEALALSRLHGAQASNMEIEAAANQRMARAMSEMGGSFDGPQSIQGYVGETPQPGVPQSLASPYEKLSALSIKEGLPAQGMKYAEGAALVRLREASALQHQATTNKENRDGQVQQVGQAASLLTSTRNQAEFDRANALYAYLYGSPSPYAGAPWSPELLTQISSGAVKVADQIRLQQNAEDNASKDALRHSREGFIEFQKGRIAEDQRLRQEREDRLAKGGGKAIGSPTPAERTQAEDLILGDFPEMKGDTAIKKAARQQAAYTIASRARVLRQANTALDPDEAIRQAYGEAKMRGDFQSTGKAFQTLDPSSWFAPAPKTTFTRGGPSAVPVPFPTDKSQWKAGTVYNHPTKGLLLYKGPNQWEPVAAPSLSTPVQPAATPLMDLVGGALGGNEEGDQE